MRPDSLRDVAEWSVPDPDAFGRLLGEFADTFYLAGSDEERAACLRPVPPSTGDALHDAWIGAAAEHLARKWGLAVPDWCGRAIHTGPEAPVFHPANPKVAGILFVESPAAFRSRNLFVLAEPLGRARMPRNKRSTIGLPPPSEELSDRLDREDGFEEGPIPTDFRAHQPAG